MTMTMKLIFYLFVSISTTLSSCPDGWLHHGQSCYQFSHDIEAMPLASLLCQHMGGDLVEIETSEENNYLTAKLKALNGHFLIGLTDVQKENIWLWYGSHKPLAGGNFANWAPGQPNNGGNAENCVTMTPQTGQWHDVACHDFWHYICEKADESNVIVG